MSDSTQNPPPPEETPIYAPPPPPAEGGYYQSAPPPMQMPSGIGQPADLGSRFVARLIDYVLLIIVNVVLVTIVVVGAIMGSSGGALGMGGNFAAGAVSAVIGAIIYLGYFALMESRNGQTIGKMVMKPQTQAPGGGTPTLEQAIRRNIWSAFGILGVVPIIGGLIGGLAELVAVIMIAVGISSSPTRQAWHDNFAGGTQVIKIG
jgi:uncharacterized RDD family membrane protein YckC